MEPAMVPAPAALLHLRPTDLKGAAVVTVAAATTTLGAWTSLSDAWTWWLGGQVLLAASLVQWFAILHECGHDTLFRTRRLHPVVGTVAGLLTLIPYRCWTRVHGRHHRWTGWQDLDPTTEALVPRPLRAVERAVVNISWRVWLPLFSILYRAGNFWNVPRLLRMFPRPGDRYAIARDLSVAVVLYGLLIAWLGPAVLIRVTALAVFMSLVAEDLLLLSQHTHIPQHVSGGAEVRPYAAIEQEQFTRSLRLPAWVSSWLLHVDAHELHHMYPFVPGYHLRRIPYQPVNEIGAWQWIAGAKRMRGDVLLFQNRLESGYDL